MWKYVKTAFLQHWNLLAFAGASAFALLSGHADVWLPVVFAGELGYLTLLGTHPKFQAYVNAQEAKQVRESLHVDANSAYRRILSTLPREAVKKFEDLRDRCEELQEIAREVRQGITGEAGGEASIADMQLEGLDRLLWLYLKLLLTHHSLNRFLRTTREERIRHQIDRIEERMDRLEKEDESPTRNSMLDTLRDDLATCEDRLRNVTEAQEKLQHVDLEIARLENKIHALAEMAVNRRHPADISQQVDEAAGSMQQTEELIDDLQSFSGLERETGAPQIVRRRVLEVQ